MLFAYNNKKWNYDSMFNKYSLERNQFLSIENIKKISRMKYHNKKLNGGIRIFKNEWLLTKASKRC